jgi:hypothetical protein
LTHCFKDGTDNIYRFLLTYISISTLSLNRYRLDYLKNANLFADDVRKEHEAQERKRFKDALIANREKAQAQEGSDLGLW